MKQPDLNAPATSPQTTQVVDKNIRGVPAGSGGVIIRAVLASTISPATIIALSMRFERWEETGKYYYGCEEQVRPV